MKMRMFLLASVSLIFLVSSVPTISAQEQAVTRSPWWSGYQLMSLETNMDNLNFLAPRAIIGHPVVQDLGQGSIVRGAADWLFGRSYSRIRRSRSIPIGYMDTFGSSLEVMTWTSQDEDQQPERFTRNGPAKTLATAWTFEDRIPLIEGKDEKDRAEVEKKVRIRWLGLSHFVNNPQGWLGKYNLINAKIPKPVGTDNEDAGGFDPQTSTHPLNSLFHRKLSGKSLFGKIYSRSLWESDDLEKWTKGSPQPKIGAFEFVRDIAAPWWNQYNIQTIVEMLRNGARGIWTDYNSGEKFIGLRPIESAFGEWSLVDFQRKVLARRDLPFTLGAVATGLRTYMVEKAKRLDPTFNPAASDADQHVVWQHPAWTEDGSWLAFLAFKAQVLRARSQELYETVKNRVRGLGLDPAQVPIILGDAAKNSYPSFSGKEGDIVATEVGPRVNNEFEPLGLGTPEETSYGPTYTFLASLTMSPIMHIWFRFDQVKDMASEFIDRLSRIALSEGLAHNAIGMIPSQEISNGTAIQVWNEFKRVVDAVNPVFEGRERTARVGIFHSASTTLSYLAPGGMARKAERLSDLISPAYHLMALQGWAMAMETQHIPYRVIPEFRLSRNALAGIQALIFPHVTALDASAIEFLTPFIERGGIIIVSGNNLGRTRTIDGFFQAQASPFQKWHKSLSLNQQSQVIFTKEGLGQEYFLYHRKRIWDQRDRVGAMMFDPIKKKLIDKGTPMTDIKTEGQNFLPIQIVQHVRNGGGGRTYIDFVNKDFNRETGVFRMFNGGTIIIGNKPFLESSTVRWLDWDNPRWSTASMKKIDDFTISVSIPRFRHYGSLVIEGTR